MHKGMQEARKRLSTLSVVTRDVATLQESLEGGECDPLSGGLMRLHRGESRSRAAWRDSTEESANLAAVVRH